MPTQQNPLEENPIEGILLVNKPRGKTSFNLVAILRKIFGVKKIGHAGTLDPFATGVMVMLIGRKYTRLSDRFLSKDKEYETILKLGESTDTYDCEGTITNVSTIVPTIEALELALQNFQGEIEQIPPMYSAKKINGQKLCDLARQGKEVERKPVTLQVATTLISYEYPYVKLRIKCSKGTYIRSIGHDLGLLLGCGAHLTQLLRKRSGTFHLEECIDGSTLVPTTNLKNLQHKLLDLTQVMI